jgi:hypothetical protein
MSILEGKASTLKPWNHSSVWDARMCVEWRNTLEAIRSLQHKSIDVARRGPKYIFRGRIYKIFMNTCFLKIQEILNYGCAIA